MRLESELGTSVGLVVASFEVEPGSDGARGHLSGSLRALDDEWAVSISLDASWCAASWYL